MVLESITVALKEEGIEEIPKWVKPLIQIYIKPFKQSPPEETPADTIVEVLQKG